MKKLTFTYHMEKIDHKLGCSSESAETCITLPMTEKLASDIMNHGIKYVPLCIKLALAHIAEMQDYSFTEVVSVDEADDDIY